MGLFPAIPDEALAAMDAALSRAEQEAGGDARARPLWDKHALSHYGEEQLLGHWGDYLHRIYPELSARPGNAGAEKELTGIPVPE